MELDICSHDAPGQQLGTKCIRCGKLLPGEPPKEEIKPRQAKGQAKEEDFEEDPDVA